MRSTRIARAFLLVVLAVWTAVPARAWETFVPPTGDTGFTAALHRD